MTDIALCSFCKFLSNVYELIFSDSVFALCKFLINENSYIHMFVEFIGNERSAALPTGQYSSTGLHNFSASPVYTD
jgi:hypothetical protein